MSERIHVLAQQLFGKSSVDDCDLQEIKDLVSRFPYFAPAQFLLLEKLKRDKASEYPAQLQKAVLYYHNPLEFEYFISSDRFETNVNFEESAKVSPASVQQDEQQPEPVIAASDGEVINVQSEETVPAEIHVKDFAQDLPETDVDPEIENAVNAAQDEQMAEAIERVLEKEEEQIKEPSQNADLVFEPYHTVDYFASQGIKLSQEEIPKDKFGRQLKSFTEWLKTLKRLPAAEVTKEIDTSAESKVQHLAEDSVHSSDVVTEAMAEVWIKQGNREKAIETYNKLGLLNPSKKAYFAGLIENLKRS
jgi:hypothetical protein